MFISAYNFHSVHSLPTPLLLLHPFYSYSYSPFLSFLPTFTPSLYLSLKLLSSPSAGSFLLFPYSILPFISLCIILPSFYSHLCSLPFQSLHLHLSPPFCLISFLSFCPVSHFHPGPYLLFSPLLLLLFFPTLSILILPLHLHNTYHPLLIHPSYTSLLCYFPFRT